MKNSNDMFTRELFKYNKLSGYYMISNKIDDRVYIGIASNLYKRASNHLCDLRANRHGNAKLQNFVNKYGIDKLVFNVLEVCDNPTIDKEVDLIDQHDSINKGFNIVRDSRLLDHIDRKAIYVGGSKKKGVSLSEEVKQRIKEGVREHFKFNKKQTKESWSQERIDKNELRKFNTKIKNRQKTLDKRSLVTKKSNGRPGSKHHNALITEDTVKLILTDINNKIKRNIVINKYNITIHIYKDIKARKSWKHVNI